MNTSRGVFEPGESMPKIPGKSEQAANDEVSDYAIMSVSELEQAELVQRERRMTITIDFGEIVKHKLRIVR